MDYSSISKPHLPMHWFLQDADRASGHLPLGPNRFTDGWFTHKIRKALFSMSIEIVNTIVGILFVGIWLIVGHIITINHS
jgi:hypothetical protein